MNSCKLRREYILLIPRLQAVINFVKDKLQQLSSSDFQFELNVKPFKSIMLKMEKRDLSNPTDLSDLVRGRLYFSDKYQFDDVKDILKKMFKTNIKDFDKKRGDKTALGLYYFGVMHVDLDFDGINFELQVIPIEHKPYKEILHNIYEKVRNLDECESNQNKNNLKSIHNKIISALTRLSKINRRN